MFFFFRKGSCEVDVCCGASREILNFSLASMTGFLPLQTSDL